MAERQIGEDVRQVFDSDEGVAHFTVAAEAASREAEAARATAEAACGDLKTAWIAAESKWGELRRAYKRRDEEERAPREVPRPDFPAPIPPTSAHRHPWPGGKRPEGAELQ